MNLGSIPAGLSILLITAIAGCANVGTGTHTVVRSEVPSTASTALGARLVGRFPHFVVPSGTPAGEPHRRFGGGGGTTVVRGVDLVARPGLSRVRRGPSENDRNRRFQPARLAAF